MVAVNHGVPVRVEDVAQIQIGHQPRLGIAGIGASDDIVQGIVLMRRGAESMPTIEQSRRPRSATSTARPAAARSAH